MPSIAFNKMIKRRRLSVGKDSRSLTVVEKGVWDCAWENEAKIDESAAGQISLSKCILREIN